MADVLEIHADVLDRFRGGAVMMMMAEGCWVQRKTREELDGCGFLGPPHLDSWVVFSGSGPAVGLDRFVEAGGPGTGSSAELQSKTSSSAFWSFALVFSSPEVF